MNIPKHIALIPDGNRRWANARGLKPWEGHKAGIARFREFLNWCYDLGVEEVTAYSLSKENFGKREQVEMQALFRLYEDGFRDLLMSPEVAQRDLNVRFAGDLEIFPKSLKDLVEEVEAKTKDFKKRRLTLCINYSGREEILRAAEGLAKSGKPATEKNFEEFLEIKSKPDLVIRTAEHRISNFLLWQAAYSEMYFSPKMFPEFTKDDLMNAINQYNKTERKYGR